MRALILSDLHLPAKVLYEEFYTRKYKRTIPFDVNSYDLVLISGDVVESSIMNWNNTKNPLNALYSIFEKPVIFCLGNHEFAYQSHPKVIDYWKQWKHPNVHCLDIEGHVDINNIRFVGNVLWYDFSLNNCTQLMQGEIIDSWLDSTIKDFDPILENKNCVKQILDNCSTDKSINHILITHTVPHIDLNTFSIETPTSPFNAYSGMKRFILDIQDQGINITHAICGHTHKRECKTILGIDCINVGNDYFHRTGYIKHMIIDINK